MFARFVDLLWKGKLLTSVQSVVRSRRNLRDFSSEFGELDSSNPHFVLLFFHFDKFHI
jgi:hypothetical protein